MQILRHHSHEADRTARAPVVTRYAATTPARGERVTHDVSVFHRLLEYERSRAERSGQGFTLLTFTGREDTASRGQLEATLAYLSRRLRSIDEVGWFDANSVGVLLPYTPVAGAWKVADDALANLGTAGEPPQCRVRAYAAYDDDADDNTASTAAEEANKGEEPRTGELLDPVFCQPLPVWKRLLDFLGAGFGLLLLSPLLLLTAALIKLTSRGPVLFKQQRTGLGGRHFTMYKFRTMVLGAEKLRGTLLAYNEQDGPAFKIKRDPRVTRIGRLLRKSSIDELPQLWNVLRGEMSLVGPRPLPCFESDACAAWQKRRLDVTPGLTCIWQVRGRSQSTFDEWMRMDLQYVRRRTLLQDLKLLVLTLPAVLLRRGAH
jgi:lipopolysaccharide/colanic/teichoic acid biosynthesis glycosyltransferase